MENLDRLTLYDALKAARLGREVLLHYFGRIENISEKHLAGLVSEADRESEQVIFEFLKKRFPEDDFLGEEGSVQGYKAEKKPGTRGRWIVDPLDGTTNYIHRFPIFTVSIGFELDGKIQVAVVDAPKMNEVYSAVRGEGAFLNGERLRVSRTPNLKKSLLATGFFGDHEDALQEQLKIFSSVVRKCRGIRRAGAASYDLAQVARGTFDAYWEKNLSPWDTAAGSLLVEEAGGKVSTYRTNSFHVYQRTILSSNGVIHRETQEALAPHLDGSSD
jgi:myo-inositol-1(or 4)-monophosphatase